MSIPVKKAPGFSMSASELDRWRKVPVSVIVDLDPSLRQIDPDIALLQSRVQAHTLTQGDDDTSMQPILFGRAVTARCQPPDFGAVLHAIDHVGKNDVLVIAADGFKTHAMIGDILGGHLRSKGVAGCVCDGAVRDTAALASWNDFPVYCKAVTPRGPVGAVCGAVNETVMIAGCEVRPGDQIIGDADGLVALSEEDMCSFIDAAEARLKQEAEWARRLADGETVDAVFGL